MFRFAAKTVSVLLSICLVMAGLLLLGPASAQAGAPDEILIGTTVSESGYMAEDSIPSFKGRKLAVELVNKDGGMFLSKFNKKVPVKLVYYDDKSEPSAAVRSFQRLANMDKVDFFLSAHGSTLSFAVAKIAETSKIPMTIYAGYANKIWTQGYKYIFNVGPTASQYCQAFVNLAKSLPDKPKVGLIHEDGLWAKAVSGAMVKMGKAAGVEVAAV